MASPSSLRIAVVGRNVSAALWVQALQAAGGFEVLWLQTEHDRATRDEEAWLLRTGSSLPLPGETNGGELFVFHRGDRREPMSAFSKGQVLWPDLRALPDCVRRQILARGLASDLTPELWKKGPGGQRVPDPDWVSRHPLSMPVGAGVPELRRVSRRFALESLERQAREAGATLASPDQAVLSLRIEGGGAKHQITFNAPFGYEEVDAVLWTSVLDRPKEEASKNHRLRLHPWTDTVGRWSVFESVVDASLVAGLPESSLWIVGEVPTTGLLRGGQLARVQRGRAMGRSQGQVRLQVERLVLKGDTWAPPSRPDDFLWSLLPALGKAPLSFKRIICDEFEFFEDPRSRLVELSPRVAFWSPGALGREDEALVSWLKPKPKPAAKVARASPPGAP